MSNQSILRITRELSEIQKSSDLSLAVSCRDDDVRNVRAIIIGPPDTPYQFGFFEFVFRFGRDYPARAPAVTALTTNSGRCRFNPNIYQSGKVCLSILGTWRGERGEEWSSAQGLESILISMQSLMSSNPYENEPGFEDAKSDTDKLRSEQYVQKIRHETLRISVIQRLESYLNIGPDSVPVATTAVAPARSDLREPTDEDEAEAPVYEPFKDLCKRRFLWYYSSYLQTIAEHRTKVAENQPFATMPFESPGNTMEGKYRYTELDARLRAIRAALDRETERWAREGAQLQALESGIAANLQRQFEQTVEAFRRHHDGVALDLELADGNPFVWRLTYFGRPMTNLDGGLFRIRLSFSPRFPDEQPRARVETPLFHHRISDDGVVCYFPQRAEDARAHVEGIIDALEEDDPPYDPRTLVNPTAAKLYWGTPSERKDYNRRLRRAVQRTLE